jgi:hypothetical protein
LRTRWWTAFAMDSLRTRWGRWWNLPDRVKAYNLTFRHPSGQIVLADLMTFCGTADEAPQTDSQFMQGRAAGRRDVALRVQEHLNLTHEELYAVLQGRSILRKEDFR